MLRILTASVALVALGLPGLAQDFNAAPPNGPENEPAFENQTRAPALPSTQVAATRCGA